MATMYPEQEHLAALDVETARLENALAASNAALDELREQQEGQEDALRGAAQTMREAKELDDACCVTIEGLRSENARLNGMLLLERDRDEVNRAKHGDILRAKAREADTARAASEAREEALDARLAKLRDSIVRATALVAEKDALRATNAQRHDVNADMAALIRSGSVHAAHVIVRDAEASEKAEQQRLQRGIAAVQATLVARETQVDRAGAMNQLIRSELVLARRDDDSIGRAAVLESRLRDL